MTQVRVVHVAESFASGVAHAVVQYAKATPQLSHRLLYAERADAPVDTKYLSAFDHTAVLHKRPLLRARQLRNAATEATHLHLHSSWAGLYGRITDLTGFAHVVYTPHCFAFERTGGTSLANVLTKSVEKRLLSRTSVIAACSPREARLSFNLGFSGEIVFVPNAMSTLMPNQPLRTSGDKLTIAAAGRISRQKNPRAFEKIATYAESRYPGIFRFVWIGDGDQDSAAGLKSARVRVTGWLPEADVARELSNADVYVHVASWEGFPVSLLEAAATGLPIVALSAPYTEGFPDDALFASTRQATQKLHDLQDNANRSGNFELWRAFLNANSRDVQAGRLLQAYGLAS